MSIFNFITYIITCIFELCSILLSLSFMIKILEISNQFIKLLLSSTLYILNVNIVLFYIIYVWYKN
jgi:hypothetical protein